MNPPFVYEATVEKYLHGVRIDSFLVKHLRSYTAWKILRLAKAGCISIEGEVVGPEQRVFTGRKVSVKLVEPPDLLTLAQNIPFEIVYEDQWLLVVNKPAGLIAHPTGEIPSGTLINAVQQHLDQAAPFAGFQKPGVVHRLDMDTSGVMALCKDHLSHRLLSLHFQNERVSKSYLAIVEGVLPEDTVSVTLPIGRAAGYQAALMSARGDAIDTQPSRTNFEVVRRMARHTLVRCRPRTGRMHQIRVHLATIGFPIMGDEFYGPGGAILPRRAIRYARGYHAPGVPWEPSEDELAEMASVPDEPPVSPYISRQALHAASLSFAHPMTLDWAEFEASLPVDFESALAAVS